MHALSQGSWFRGARASGEAFESSLGEASHGETCRQGHPTGRHPGPVFDFVPFGLTHDRQMDVLGGILPVQPLRYAGEQVKWLNSKLCS